MPLHDELARLRATITELNEMYLAQVRELTTALIAVLGDWSPDAD